MYRLKAVLTDRRELDLEPRHTQHASAQRAATAFIRDFRDPCGLGVGVAYVEIIDTALERVAA